MRIDAEYAQAWFGDAERTRGFDDGFRRVDYQVGRDPFERIVNSLMQRHMADTKFRRNQQQEHAVFRCAGQLRDQSGIAGEWNAGAVDRCFRVRASNDRIHCALLRQCDGGAHIRNDCRPGFSENFARPECFAGKGRDIHIRQARCIYRRIGIERHQRQLWRVMRIVPQHERVADQYQLDALAMQLRRRLDGDFRADAVGLADGDRNSLDSA